MNAWAKRRAAYELALNRAPFVTPTLLKRTQEKIALGSVQQGLEPTSALLVGDLAHAFLQSWDFTADPRVAGDGLNALVDSLAEETAQGRAKIAAELGSILRSFFRSKTYAELAAARILGREVPLLMPWNGQIMEGVIDLIYERNGLLYLADYKTDSVENENLSEAAARYQQQAEIYSQAVRQSIGREPAGFKIIFLRVGEAVEIFAEKNKELWLF
jgi:ATP-dependent helicase/nuclease subunit A